MRVLILTIAVLGFAMPAFADCNPTHTASSSKTIATTSTPPQTPPATPSSGG